MFALIPLALSLTFVGLGVYHEAYFLLWVATAFWAIALFIGSLEIRARNHDNRVNLFLDGEDQ